MKTKNEYASTKPFDLYTLFLFKQVAQQASFTKAGNQVGLTQSAITKQIQKMEEHLGIQLLERTTRSVRLTAAGISLLEKSDKILNALDDSIHQLREDFGDAPKTLKVGMSQTIGLSYLPGFFVPFRKRHSQINIQMRDLAEQQLIANIDEGDIDAGILTEPKRITSRLQIKHRFSDDFVLIIPPDLKLKERKRAPHLKHVLPELEDLPWISISHQTQAGQEWMNWISQKSLNIRPQMQLDSFDTIINLVSLGLGISMVPIRAIALYGKRRLVKRILLKETFSRNVVVLTRKTNHLKSPLKEFIDCIAF